MEKNEPHGAAGAGRCLSHINDIVKRPVEASTYDVHDKFDVTVEEGDGAVTNKLIPRLARLVDEANETEEERGEGEAQVVDWKEELKTRRSTGARMS